MSALDLFVTVAVVAAVVFSLMSSPADLSTPGPAPLPVRPWRSRWRPATGPTLRGDLVFVERLGARTLGLDCLLRRLDGQDETVSPVHVRARCSVTWWAAERFMDLVERWADGADPVRVELVPYAGSLRAKISHRDSCLILDVLATERRTSAGLGARAA